jgi:DNA-binding GntR family transcriptional regulator
VKPATAQEVVKTEILKKITTGEIGAGELIRQDAMARELGVSQAPVREALKVLEGMGVVIHQPHQGHRVRQYHEHELEEIYLFRRILESQVVRRSVELITPSDLDALTGEVDFMEHLDPDQALFELRAANERFHFAIYRASQMGFFVEQIELAWSRTRPYRSLLYNDPTHRRRLDSEHRAMIEALRCRDADELIRLQNTHRASALRNIRGLIERLGESANASLER